MKNAIITSTDAKYGDFVLNHWLKSLKDNADLSNIDVIILDYGLTDTQVKHLKKEKAIVKKCIRDGHIVNLRFRDLGKVLRETRYDQVMMTDGADIIFQTDVSELFKKNKQMLRGVCEGINPIYGILLKKKIFGQYLQVLKDTLAGKRFINIGVLVGPADKMKKVCNSCQKVILDKNVFGPDTLAVNYAYYDEGFIELEDGYNFIPATSFHSFTVKEGFFFFKDGTKIPIFHNAGNVSFLRVIDGFGYGPDRNKVKIFQYLLLRLFYVFKRIKSRLFNVD